MARFNVFSALFVLFAFIAGAFAATAGCGKAPTITSGTKSINVGGQNRQYIIKVPGGYDQNKPYRVVFGLHWLGGTMNDVATGQTVQRDVWAYYGLDRLSANSTIFIAPQGNSNGWANPNNADVNFIDAIIAQVDAGLCVNEKLRFATGFSYGGAMSYSLACNRPNVFRAVAVLSGGLLSGGGACSSPVAYYGQHGIGDTVLPVSMGRQMKDTFVRSNGCQSTNAGSPSAGSRKHVRTNYSGCQADKPVVWVEFDEGHIAAPQDGAAGDSGTNTFSPKYTWEFFSSFT